MYRLMPSVRQLCAALAERLDLRVVTREARLVGVAGVLAAVEQIASWRGRGGPGPAARP
jgi:hypothetical protein